MINEILVVYYHQDFFMWVASGFKADNLLL